jgi:hypothetical protein
MVALEKMCNQASLIQLIGVEKSLTMMAPMMMRDDSMIVIQRLITMMIRRTEGEI